MSGLREALEALAKDWRSEPHNPDSVAITVMRHCGAQVAGALAEHPEDKFQNVKRGLWRNELGAELHVIGTANRRHGVTTIGGDIAIAEDRDPGFRTVTVLVTNHSLQRCGYELIEEAADGE